MFTQQQFIFFLVCAAVLIILYFLAIKFKNRPKKKKAVKYNWNWVIPSSRIIDTPPDISFNADNEVKPEELITLLWELGIKCEPTKAAVVASSTITFSYNLQNKKDFKKVKPLVETISAMLRRSVLFGTSSDSDFCLSVERSERATLHFKRALLTEPFVSSNNPTACILGLDTEGESVSTEISKLPHLLIAGATGSGKSVLLHTIICSMLFKASPSCTRFIMVDVKMVELTRYNNLPHLMTPVITEAKEAVGILESVCKLMDERYAQMAANPNIDLPSIVVIIDELADLMLLSKSNVENHIVRLAQKARAAKIHLIIATQSPRVAVLTGLIRSNIPARVGLRTATAIDSRICIEQNGCEKLLGKGDGYFIDPANGGTLQRFQAAYISDDDISRIIHHWCSDNCKAYN